MNERNQMSNDWSALEARLSRLVPAGISDQSALMFRAGYAAGERTRRRWQVLTAIAACLAAGTAMLAVFRPQPQIVERVVYMPQHEVAPVAQAPPVSVTAYHGPTEPLWARGQMSDLSYFRLRQQVLEHGLSALPVWSGFPGGAQEPPRLRDELRRAISNG